MGIARLGMMLRGVALLVVFASIGHCTTEEGKKWLAENAKKPGVIELPSGLQYKVVKSVAKGKSPSASSPCECHYRGTLTDGTEFDSSYKRGKPTTFAPNQVVSGWTEAMQLMKQGEKWELFLPSELAYGESKRGQHITPGAVLVFELEILKVNEGGPFDWITGQPHYLIFGAFILFKLYQSGVFGGGAAASAGPLVPMSEATSANDPRVFFDITIGEEAAGRIEFELFQKVVPKTVENFRCLCTGEKDASLHFKDSGFHRIIPGFMCQGGDFTHHNGRGGKSIYGSKFADEFDNGHIAHSEAMLLSMANSGPNTNGSQFFITVGRTPHLDGKHVVFGRLCAGKEVVEAMEAVGSSSGDCRKRVMIADCGEVATEKKAEEKEEEEKKEK